MNLNDVLPLRPSTSPPPPSPHLYEGPLCILVVDDDPIAREYLAETLRSQGHEVLTLGAAAGAAAVVRERGRSEEHTSELQSREKLVCRLLLEKKKINFK